MLQVDRPKPGTIMRVGGGGLGSSGGMALGAKLAAPEQMMVQVVGDGSFYFNSPCSVFAVAQHYKLPILSIVVDNSGWSAVKHSTLRVYPDGEAKAADEYEVRAGAECGFRQGRRGVRRLWREDHRSGGSACGDRALRQRGPCRPLGGAARARHQDVRSSRDRDRIQSRARNPARSRNSAGRDREEVMLKLTRLALAGLVVASVATGALAQKYPSRTIEIIVAYGPGGSTDLVARALALKFQERLGQSVVVLNKAGGSGTIGATLAARAAPTAIRSTRATPPNWSWCRRSPSPRSTRSTISSRSP